MVFIEVNEHLKVPLDKYSYPISRILDKGVWIITTFYPL